MTLKELALCHRVPTPQKGGLIFEGKSAEVIENTYRNNARILV
jgi:hypothetical protein